MRKGEQAGQGATWRKERDWIWWGWKVGLGMNSGGVAKQPKRRLPRAAAVSAVAGVAAAVVVMGARTATARQLTTTTSPLHRTAQAATSATN
jgi:hypothetical protein